jgi:hypothetical protein
VALVPVLVVVDEANATAGTPTPIAETSATAVMNRVGDFFMVFSFHRNDSHCRKANCENDVSSLYVDLEILAMYVGVDVANFRRMSCSWFSGRMCDVAMRTEGLDRFEHQRRRRAN